MGRVLLTLCLLVSGCATQTAAFRADGSFTQTCAAVGEKAVALMCKPQGSGGVLTSAPEECGRCEGGPILPSLLDMAGSLVKAVWSILPWVAP